MKLIDADNLTKNLTYDIANHPMHGNFKITMASVRAAISNAPAVDAVPVVRCKDCKHFNLKTHECENEDISTDHEGGASYSLNFCDDDFCSYGERKEANT